MLNRGNVGAKDRA